MENLTLKAFSRIRSPIFLPPLLIALSFEPAFYKFLPFLRVGYNFTSNSSTFHTNPYRAESLYRKANRFQLK